jgi:hypothetical protein
MCIVPKFSLIDLWCWFHLFLNYLYLDALLNLKVSYAFMLCSLMKEKLKTICMFFHMIEHMFDFHCFISVIFHLCSISCYNMVAKFLLSRLYLSCPCFKFFWSHHSMLYILDQDCVGACHLKNYFFCYHLPTRGRAGVKLGDADTYQMYL